MIGVIADDFTGGTDVAVFLRRTGLRTEIRFGPESLAAPQTPSSREVDAVVVALKTRTLPAEQAVTQSLRAASWLREHGADQLFFKYCSTFDSTAVGNIGPVADALLDLMGSSTTVVVPASPAHGRTQYAATLFVHGVPLAESPMRHHPLTPMTDSDVVRLLQAQTARPVASISWSTVRQGPAAIRAEVAAAQRDGVAYLVIDALDDADLDAIGQACQDLPLLTGAAGLAGGLGSAAAASTPTSEVPVAPAGERAAALAGSCSARTLEQIELMQRHHASYHLDALRTPDARALAAEALRWFDAQPADAPAPLIYSSQPPEQLRRVQDQLGTERASGLLEEAAGLVARGLVERGVRRLVVAGGETSGAVVTALGAPSGLIGAEEAPGVPWIRVDGEQPLWLLLKSGNFGDTDLLVRACEGGAVRA